MIRPGVRCEQISWLISSRQFRAQSIRLTFPQDELVPEMFPQIRQRKCLIWISRYGLQLGCDGELPAYPALVGFVRPFKAPTEYPRPSGERGSYGAMFDKLFSVTKLCRKSFCHHPNVFIRLAAHLQAYRSVFGFSVIPIANPSRTAQSKC